MTGTDAESQGNLSLWLPEGEPIVTPEREAKGDLLIERDAESHIRFAQAQVRNILSHLRRSNILDAQHVHEGQIYEVWQICFSAELGYRNNPVYASEIPGMRRIILDDGLDAADFEKLIRALTLNQKHIIEFTIYTIATEHSRWFADKNHKAFRAAFDRMSEVMKRLRDEAEERQKNKDCINNSLC